MGLSGRVGVAEGDDDAGEAGRRKGAADENQVADMVAHTALPAERDRTDVLTAGRVPVGDRADGEGDGESEEELEARGEHLIPTW